MMIQIIYIEMAYDYYFSAHVLVPDHLLTNEDVLDLVVQYVLVLEVQYVPDQEVQFVPVLGVQFIQEVLHQ